MPTTPPTPADRLIDRFARSHRHDWSQANRDNAVRVLNRVHEWLVEAGLTLIDADSEGLFDALDDYLAHRRSTPKPNGEPYAVSSLLVEHRQLCAFYKWATSDPGDGVPLMARNPMRRIAAPQPDPVDPKDMPVAEQWQYEALMATTQRRRTRNGNKPMCDRRDAAIIGLLWYTGMRRSELCNIDFDHVDFDQERIYLPRTKGGRRAPKSRWVTLPHEAMRLLDLWIDERGSGPGPLFPSATRAGARLEPQSVTLILRRRAELAGRKLGVDPTTIYTPAHSFRRSSAIAWLDAGGSEVGLKRNHGWSTDAMIDRYTGARADALTAAEARRVAEARDAGRRQLRAV